MTDKVIQLIDVVKDYQFGSSRKVVLDGVSLSVAKGELVGIYGQSGSGKSTLLNIISGMEQVTSGYLQVVGRIGFVHQRTRLLEELTVLENVLFPKIGGIGRGDLDMVMDILNDLSMGGKVGMYPNQLSGGERQRVSIARALVINPEIMLMDEPTGSLDDLNTSFVMDELSEMRDKIGFAVLMVTHNHSFMGYFDKVYDIAEGKLNLQACKPYGGFSSLFKRRCCYDG